MPEARDVRSVDVLQQPPHDIAVEPTSAAGCTALGCTARAPLYELDTPDHGTRVLCAAHARDLIHEEVRG